MNSALPVVVVGGGPVGIVAANLLDLQGVPVVVVERERDVHPLPRAANLDDEALRILQGLGVGEAIRTAVHAVRGVQLATTPDDVVWHLRDDLSPSPNGWPRTNLFQQPLVERALRDRLARSPRARVLLGREVRTLTPDGDAVRVGLGDQELTASWVLACDGANSTVRELLGIPLHDRGFAQRWLVVDTEVDALLTYAVPQQICDPAQPRTFVPMAPGRYRWEFLLQPGVDVDGFLAEASINERVVPWTGGHEVRVVRQAAYRFRSLRAQRWREGRVFLLGDAAHQMPPFLGQGLCAGLRDAANLTWKLALVREGAAGDALLDTYQAERAPHVDLATSLAVGLGWLVAGRGRGLLRLGARLPAPVRRRLEHVETPGLRPGPLVRPAGWALRRVRSSGLLGRGDAGFTFPQPRVTRAGRSVPLDEVLGPGFALVGLGEDPWRLLSDPAQRFWKSVGARAVQIGVDAHDPAGLLTGWFRRHHAHVAVVRPDRYVLAVCQGPGLLTLEETTSLTRRSLAR